MHRGEYRASNITLRDRAAISHLPYGGDDDVCCSCYRAVGCAGCRGRGTVDGRVRRLCFGRVGGRI